MKFKICILLFLIMEIAKADSVGPNNPTACNQPQNNCSDTYLSDNNYCVWPGDDSSGILITNGYSFNLPETVYVEGIKLNVEGHKDANGVGNFKVRYSVWDYSSDFRYGTFGNADNIFTFGGPTDKWGAFSLNAFNLNDVPAINTGIAMGMRNLNHSTDSLYIDNAQWTIYYSAPDSSHIITINNGWVNIARMDWGNLINGLGFTLSGIPAAINIRILAMGDGNPLNVGLTFDGGNSVATGETFGDPTSTDPDAPDTLSSFLSLSAVTAISQLNSSDLGIMMYSDGDQDYYSEIQVTIWTKNSNLLGNTANRLRRIKLENK